MAHLKERSLYNILSESNYFEIPIYQRNYTWTKEDCIKFLNDIYNNFIDNKAVMNERTIEYYVGNVIIFDLDTDHKVIIDGQQRITTTILILCALRKVIKDKSNSEQVLRWIEDNINRYLQYKNLSSSEIKLKLNNIKNSRDLEDIINDHKTLNFDSIYTINYFALVKKIEQIKTVNEKYAENIKASLEKTLLVQVTIKDYDNPNKMFEVINTTGKKLLASDLIKNYIFFYSSKYPEQIANFSSEYEEIESLIGNKENDIMKFFRYVVPMMGYGFKLQPDKSNKIYEDFKRLFDENQNYKFSRTNLLNPDDIEYVLQELKKHAIIWNAIHNFSSKDKQIDFYYKTFQTTMGTYYSLVHQYLFDNIKVDKDEEYKVDCLLMVGILKVINRLIFSLLLLGKEEKNITRDIPNIYPKYKEETGNGQMPFEEWFEKRDNSDIKLLDKKGFRKRINSTPVYASSSKKTKYLLIGLEMFATDWEKDIAIEGDSLTIEHIIPQHYDKSTDFWTYAKEENSGDEEKADEWITKNLHTLPNLTIITGKLNGKISNKSFTDKKAIMKDKTAFDMNNKINEYPEWKEFQLRDRGDKLTNLIVGLLGI